MSSSPSKVLVWTLSFYRQPMTLEEYQCDSRLFLAAVRRSLPPLSRLAIAGSKGAHAIAPDLHGVEDDIAAAVFDKNHTADYLRLTGSGQLGLRSLSRIGFSLTYGSLAEDGSMLSLDEGGMRMRIRGTSSSIEPETTAVVEMAETTALAFADGGLRRCLEDMITRWRGNFGGVTVTRYQPCVRGNDRGSYAGQWLFYLPFPNLAACLPSDIRHEPFANGILIETTPHLPNANNPQDVAAGKRVRDVLDEFGLVNDATYAIEGWPPDEEEQKYEQYISGAPANRKYTVHCINFGGYDPDRKVLLYAKLFRRLKRHPKEWGHRGWDGPVLNEAKRQVKAAAKAGGVRIEWHIGLEEPAHQVRQLLADYTNITEQQLRVIYTPLEEALTNST